jgi:hypothetical protein
MRPSVNVRRVVGSSRSARATRTYSRAVRRSTPQRHDSHWAQDLTFQPAHPCRASKSPSSTRNRQVAAAICPANVQSSASTRSRGTSWATASASAAVVLAIASSLGIERLFDRIGVGGDNAGPAEPCRPETVRTPTPRGLLAALPEWAPSTDCGCASTRDVRAFRPVRRRYVPRFVQIDREVDMGSAYARVAGRLRQHRLRSMEPPAPDSGAGGSCCPGPVPGTAPGER